VAGLVAGIVFAMMEVAGAAMMGNPPLMPIRMFASVVLGRSALQGSLGTALIVGMIAHLALSAVFGVIYGALDARASEETKTSYRRQAGLGIAFGLAVWLVDFQVVARVLYPWFVGTPQFLQAMMHGIFFGLPLALVHVAAERRIHVHTPAPRTV
jgi:hypothetical protein